MSTRQWMLAVAVIALLLAAGLCCKRRYAFLELAGQHERDAVFWDVHRQRYAANGGFPILNETFFEADGTVKPQYASSFRNRSEHHAAMGRKYRRAAARPWLVVDDDPPEPW